ncbi:MAG: CDP-alcohol phosphatidyltransferase family protein [Chloroflexi bacterium]|nr:CDP-alcohol phosphatidyltransferase family protein [Chloroflexota bacterium]MQC26378.1 CDP-alcohol phosphatidyltransferase family protein [Chloroflexota bacterium]
MNYIANVLTGLRLSLALVLPILGASAGAGRLEIAVYLMLFAWMSDFFDGTVARQTERESSSWLGAHDLHVDMAVSAGLLLYMTQSHFVPAALAILYVLAWTIVFWRLGIEKASGSLVQALIYGWFLWVAGHEAPQAAIWVLVWMVILLAFTWRQFVGIVVPEFLGGMGKILRSR